ncbi:MAG: hypothetical protein PW734_06815 [Verrucomicrobium sp.]|nr:hypothetical protein [Verrucomicrobium sp.]
MSEVTITLVSKCCGAELRLEGQRPGYSAYNGQTLWLACVKCNQPTDGVDKKTNKKYRI